VRGSKGRTSGRGRTRRVIDLDPTLAMNSALPSKLAWAHCGTCSNTYGTRALIAHWLVAVPRTAGLVCARVLGARMRNHNLRMLGAPKTQRQQARCCLHSSMLLQAMAGSPDDMDAFLASVAGDYAQHRQQRLELAKVAVPGRTQPEGSSFEGGGGVGWGVAPPPRMC
jgi:hypothetical protein